MADRRLLMELKVDAKTQAAAQGYEALAKSADKAAAATGKVAKTTGGGNKNPSSGPGFARQFGQSFQERAGAFGLGEVGGLTALGKAGPAGVVAGLVLTTIGLGVEIAAGRTKELDSKVEKFAGYLFDIGDKAVDKASKKLQAKLATIQEREGAIGALNSVDESSNKASIDVRERHAELLDRAAAAEKGLLGIDAERVVQWQKQNRLAGDMTATEKLLAQTQSERAETADKFQRFRSTELALVQRQLGELSKAEEIERSLHKIREASLQLQQQAAEKELSTAEQALDKAKAALELKKQQLQSAKEEFGLSTALEKQNILELAQRLKTSGVGSLSKEELDFTKGKGSIFGDVLKQQGAALADRTGFQDLIRNQALGLNTSSQSAAVTAAQFKVEVQRQVVLELQVSEQKLAAELARQVAPIIERVQVVQAEANRLTRELVERQIGLAQSNRAAQFPKP